MGRPKKQLDPKTRETTRRLRELVDASGRTQAEIAAEIGWTRQQLGQVIHADSDPQISSVLKVLQALDLTLCDLEEK